MDESIKISARMVLAGVQVLHKSGALAFEASADSLLVRRILETALHRKNLRKKEVLGTPKNNELGCIGNDLVDC